VFKLKLEAILGAAVFGFLAWALLGLPHWQQYLVWVPVPREVLAALGALLGFMLVNALRVSRVVDEGSSDEARAALAREPAPGEALVFFRRGGGVASNGTLDLSVGGTTVSHLQGNQFTCFAVQPGAHVFSGHFLGRAATQIPDSAFNATLAAGEKAVLSLDIGFGWIRPKITWSRATFAAAKGKLAAARYVRPVSTR
jgi:hypothetical protein